MTPDGVREREPIRTPTGNGAFGRLTERLPRLADRGRAAGWTRRRLPELARRHRIFLGLAVVGLALRVLVTVAYDPALLRPDSVSYLRVASAPIRPWGFHPIAYPTFLRILPFDWTIAVVPVLHHVLGLAIAVLIYAVLVRLNVPRWLAALAAAPVLLDAYQLNIEQYILSETLFELLLVGACVLLLWRRPLGVGAAAVAGLLLAGAALTRSIGTATILPAVVAAFFLAGGLPLRARLARPAATLAVFALPLLGYAAWFQSAFGEFALAAHGGRFLYGRVIPFADCAKLEVPDWERVLCPQEPPGERMTANQLMWGRNGRSRVYRVEPPPGKERLEVVSDFSQRVIQAQPLDYLQAVGADYLRTFAPTRLERRDDVPLRRWTFRFSYPDAGDPNWRRQSGADFRRYERKRAEPGAGFLATYQRFGYTWGPALAAALVASLLATLGVGRAKWSGLRSPVFLFAGLSIVLSLGSLAATMFSWRYQLPQIVLLPAAGALALTALLGLHDRRRSGGTTAVEGARIRPSSRTSPSP